MRHNADGVVSPPSPAPTQTQTNQPKTLEDFISDSLTHSSSHCLEVSTMSSKFCLLAHSDDCSCFTFSESRLSSGRFKRSPRLTPVTSQCVSAWRVGQSRVEKPSSQLKFHQMTASLRRTVSRYPPDDVKNHSSYLSQRETAWK